MSFDIMLNYQLYLKLKLIGFSPKCISCSNSFLITTITVFRKNERQTCRRDGRDNVSSSVYWKVHLAHPNFRQCCMNPKICVLLHNRRPNKGLTTKKIILKYHNIWSHVPIKIWCSLSFNNVWYNFQSTLTSMKNHFNVYWAKFT